MNKNNVIQFAQALILLPVMAGTLSIGNVPQTSGIEAGQTVFTQKQNIALSAFFAFNDTAKEDEAAKTLKLQADAIDAYFSAHNMPLKGLGMEMVQAAEKYKLDWRLIAGISVIESTGGINACKGADYSSFGWGSCKIDFKSNEEAIEIVSMNLGGENPKTEKYYADKTTYKILRTYNSYIKNYPEKVLKVMDQIGPLDLGVATQKASA